LRETFRGGEPRRRRPVDLRVTAAVGAPLHVQAWLDGTACEVVSDQPALEAQRHPLDVDLLRAQFGRLGGTPFELRDLTARIDGRPMLPLSVLGRVRRQLVERLEETAAAHLPRRIDASARDRLGREDATLRTALAVPGAAPVLHLLCRSLEQVTACLDQGGRELDAEFADIRLYRQAIASARSAGATLRTATPRIQKPDEMGIFHLLARQEPDRVLARNFAAIRYFRAAGLPVDADFSLNVTNELSAGFFRREGVGRIVPSYDLNREQLLGLVENVPADWLEVVVHQRMPMFHMEHCVFCAVLSPGTNKTNCGRPCDAHEVKLRDRIGVEHPLTADVGCRNTLYNAVPQSGAEVVPALVARGIGHFRVELLDEQPAQVAEILAAYRALLEGRSSGREVWTRLNAANRVGVTRGTLEERRNPLAIV